MKKTAATRTVSPATKKFILEQIAERGKISFRANGQIDFFREEPLLIGRGAGGQNRTGYARLFRAALYH
jgi:hypothetical protein